MMNKIILFFLLNSTLLYGSSLKENAIIVQLDTESTLLPLYLTPLQNDQAVFDANYLNELDQILNFDLNHNGMTTLVSTDTQKNKLANGNGFDDLGPALQWKKMQVAYVVKTRIKDKQLSARVLAVNTQSLKSIADLTLSGDLRYDRRQVHLLADAIFKTLFNQNGIASTKLLYALKTKDKSGKVWSSEIYECDYDGGNAHQLTQQAGYCINPCYIPPKTGNVPGNYLYVSYQNGQPKIYVASLKEALSRRFIPLKGNQLMPTISYHRDKMAFISDITGNPDLFLQPFNIESGPLGKPYQIFSAPSSTQGSPTFSPDGNKIAFVSNKDGSPRIYVMEIPPAGTNIKNLAVKLISKANRESSAPAWSPDGSKLAYCAMTQSVRQLWIYDFNKNVERQVTHGSTHKENPSWAPNSLHISFNSTGTAGSDIYILNLNQLEATQITRGQGDKRFPNWQPVGK